MEEGAELNLGLDDSNHISNKKVEIIVATASYFEQDGESVRRKKRDPSFARTWRRDRKRDWAFTILPYENFRKTSYNIILVAPFLVRSCLSRASYNIQGAKMHIDGPVSEKAADLLYADFNKEFPNLEIYPYVKGEKGKARPNYPPVVHAADNLARYLFRNKTVSELNTHRKFVPVKLEDLLERQRLVA